MFGDTFWVFDTKQSQVQNLYMMYLIGWFVSVETRATLVQE